MIRRMCARLVHKLARESFREFLSSEAFKGRLDG